MVRTGGRPSPRSDVLAFAPTGPPLERRGGEGNHGGEAVVATRDFALRNKLRSNQILELVRARFNHEADEIVFARTLRAALEGG